MHACNRTTVFVRNNGRTRHRSTVMVAKHRYTCTPKARQILATSLSILRVIVTSRNGAWGKNGWAPVRLDQAGHHQLRPQPNKGPLYGVRVSPRRTSATTAADPGSIPGRARSTTRDRGAPIPPADGRTGTFPDPGSGRASCGQSEATGLAAGLRQPPLPAAASRRILPIPQGAGPLPLRWAPTSPGCFLTRDRGTTTSLRRCG